MFLLWLSITTAAFGACEGFEKKIIAQHSRGYTAVWHFSENPFLGEPYKGGDKSFDLHRNWVRSHTNWNARQILVEHQRVGREILERLDPRDGGREAFARGIRNAQKILDGAIGRIRPIHCLESVPFREFLRVTDVRKRPAEFQASLLGLGKELALVGDFYLPEGGYVGVRESRASRKYREGLVRKGWTYLRHLHNHPFSFGDSPEIGGVLGPSDADMGVYRGLKPEGALITNGLETIELSRRDWRRWESGMDPAPKMR